MEALTKSFNVAFELHRNPPVVIRSPFCEQCPMYILHQLCIQINCKLVVVGESHITHNSGSSIAIRVFGCC